MSVSTRMWQRHRSVGIALARVTEVADAGGRSRALLVAPLISTQKICQARGATHCRKQPLRASQRREQQQQPLEASSHWCCLSSWSGSGRLRGLQSHPLSNAKD